MPVQFICLHCQRKLSVSQRKVGAQLKCPMCQGTITVPTLEEGLALVELRDSLHGDQKEQDVLSEFVVHDNRWDDHPPAEPFDNIETESLSGHPITITRRVVYLQGGLLGLIAFLGLLLGIIIGRLTDNSKSGLSETGPIRVSGKITIEEHSTVKSDVGAVIIAFPSDHYPDEKIAVNDLRPDQRPPSDKHLSISIIEGLGGGYTRANSRGRFQLKLPVGGDYHVLVISGNSHRPEGKLPATKDLAEMGRYFLLATDLLDQYNYRWNQVKWRTKGTFNVEF